MESPQPASGMDPQRLEELKRAYASTHYRIIPWNIILKVNETHATLDEMLISSGYTEWAFITSVNPKSVSLPMEENFQRLVELRRYLGNRPCLDAIGEPNSKDWEPEPSLFIPGMTEAEAIAIGNKFGQWAVLTGQIGQKAILSWCFKE